MGEMGQRALMCGLLGFKSTGSIWGLDRALFKGSSNLYLAKKYLTPS